MSGVNLDIQTKRELGTVFTSSSSHAPTLLAALKVIHGDDGAWVWYDPVTIYMDVKEILGLQEMPSEVMERIAAIQVVMAGDQFFKDAAVFTAVCETFADGSAGFEEGFNLELEEACWGVTCVSMMRDLLPFGYYVKQLVSTLSSQEGYATQPRLVQIICDNVGNDEDEFYAEVNELLHGNPENAAELAEFLNINLQETVAQMEEHPSLRPALDRIQNNAHILPDDDDRDFA